MRKYYYSMTLLLGFLVLGNGEDVQGQSLLSYNQENTSEEQGKEKKKSMTFKSAMKKFSSHYGISFLYRTDLLDDKMVEFPSLERDMEEGLRELLLPLDADFKELRDKYIVIFSKNSSLDTYANGVEYLKVNSQYLEKRITGKITEANGESLPGATILVKGTNIGISADLDGTYQIVIPDEIENPILVFSFIGFDSQEVAVGNQTEINIVLTDNLSSLNEGFYP